MKTGRFSLDTFLKENYEPHNLPNIGDSVIIVQNNSGTCEDEFVGVSGKISGRVDDMYIVQFDEEITDSTGEIVQNKEFTFDCLEVVDSVGESLGVKSILGESVNGLTKVKIDMNKIHKSGMLPQQVRILKDELKRANGGILVADLQNATGKYVMVASDEKSLSVLGGVEVPRSAVIVSEDEMQIEGCFSVN